MDTAAEQYTPQAHSSSIPLSPNRTTWSFHRVLTALQWLAPALMITLVVIYELGPSKWIYSNWGGTHHSVAEILFYGTFGPALLFALLFFSRRFLEERETSEVQALIVTKQQKRIEELKPVADHALQVIFAANVLLTTLDANYTGISKAEDWAIRETKISLEKVSGELRNFLERQ